MAAVEDYVLLGSVFIAGALWWTVQSSKRYSFARQKQQDFFTSVTYPCCARWQKYPLEGCVKIAAAFVGIVSQVALKHEASHRASSVNHNTVIMRFMPVYCAILISGIADVLLTFYFKQILVRLTWILLALAYLLVGLVFWNPAGDAANIFIVLGQLEGFLAGLGCLVVLLESKCSHSLGFSLLRCYFTLVLGSWMCHIGILTSNELTSRFDDPTSDTNIFSTPIDELESHTKVMLVTLYFTWHCGIGMLVLLTVWMVSMRLAQHNYCPCPANESKDTDAVFLENRVYLEPIDILGD